MQSIRAESLLGILPHRHGCLVPDCIRLDAYKSDKDSDPLVEEVLPALTSGKSLPTEDEQLPQPNYPRLCTNPSRHKLFCSYHDKCHKINTKRFHSGRKDLHRRGPFCAVLTKTGVVGRHTAN